MKQFTDRAIEFAWDFMLEDVQKVFKCTKAEAIDVIAKSFKRFGSYNSVNKSAGKTFQLKSPVPVIEERTKKTSKIERPPAVYSNQNTWDKYKEIL